MTVLNRSIEIDIDQQSLVLFDGGERLFACGVSTAANGPGELVDSECTPRGRHVIDEKIGAGCAIGTVFVGRRPTGETYSESLRREHPGRDWILTRILWLRGIEPGVNAGGGVDSKARYIYIHGTPEETDMTKPGSRGCVRMRNADVVRLFEMVEVGTPVDIRAE